MGRITITSAKRLTAKVKLTAPNRSTSFYESFSDLIFATMAIFVLLMTVFLVLVNSPADDSQLQEQLEKTQAQLERARVQMEETVKSTKELQDAVQAKELELVIAVDVTGSMTEALGDLVETIVTIGKSMPSISPKVSIGVVAYGQHEPRGQALRVFTKTEIKRQAIDNGQSFESLKNYMQSLSAQGGIAPIDTAIMNALGMFSSEEFSGYQILLVLGDVGPYEQSFNDLSYDSSERAIEQRIFRSLKQWNATGERKTMVSLFSGEDSHSGVDRRKYLESLRFFKQMAISIGAEENFTQNRGKMLAYLLNAIVQQSD